MALSRLPANIVRNFDLKLPCAPFRGLANCHVVAEYHYGTSNDLRYHSVTVGRGPRRLFLLGSPDFRKSREAEAPLDFTMPEYNVISYLIGDMRCELRLCFFAMPWRLRS